MGTSDGIADTNSKTFYIMNKFMFFFGCGYSIYTIILAIVQQGNIVFNIFAILFCLLLLFASGYGHKLKNSSKGLKVYIFCTVVIFVWIVILIIVSIFQGNAFDTVLDIIRFICWCLLLAAVSFALLIAFKMASSSSGGKYAQLV